MPNRYKSLPIRAGMPWKNALTLWEIAWAAPQVIAHRTTRMALAGSQPSAHDQAEFNRMWQEKVVAFSQAAMRSGWEALRLQQSLGMALLGLSGNAALPSSVRLRHLFRQIAYCMLSATGRAP